MSTDAPPAAGSLEFRLLGPLEVVREGTPLALGGVRQRALLALLLLHANELVRTEWLAEQLFAGDTGDSAVKALRVAVSRLRRAPGGGGGTRGRGPQPRGRTPAGRRGGTAPPAPRAPG